MPASSSFNSEAIGIWTLRDAERLKRAGTWPSSFSVASIAGLQLWLDASDAGSLFDATTGGSLVAPDGGVARWQDKSGNARHATQATSGNRAVRKASVINGLDGIYFNGSSATNFESTISGLRNYTSLTIFCVIKPVAAAQADATTCVAFRYSVAGYPPTGNDELALGFSTGSLDGETITLYGPPGAGRLGSSAYSRAANTTSAFSLRTGASGTAFRVNGNDITINLTSDSTSAANISPASATTRTTDLLYIGSNGVTPAETYCELIIYNSALSDADRSLVESYLMSKWGIS